MPHSKSKLSGQNEKYGVLRYFGLNKKVWSKIWVRKNLCSRKFGSKKFGFKKFSGSKKFLSAKYLSPQKFCASLSPPIMSVPTNYVCPHLLCLSPPIVSVPTYYVCPLSPPIMSVPTYHICPHLLCLGFVWNVSGRCLDQKSFSRH